MNTLLLDAKKKQKNIPQKKGNKKAIFYTPFGGGGLKSVQELVPLVPKKRIFKILKNPYFYSVSRKSWWWSLWAKKAYVKSRTLLEGQTKMIIVFGYFRDKFLRSPQKMREAESCQRCCCWLFVVVCCCFLGVGFVLFFCGCFCCLSNILAFFPYCLFLSVFFFIILITILLILFFIVFLLLCCCCLFWYWLFVLVVVNFGVVAVCFCCCYVVLWFCGCCCCCCFWVVFLLFLLLLSHHQRDNNSPPKKTLFTLFWGNFW